MTTIRMQRLLLMAALAIPGCVAQNHEIGLTLGGLIGTDRSGDAGSLHLGAGVALQANYGYTFTHRKAVALAAEVHLLANAQRQIESNIPTTTRDVATIFVTPGLRLKFAPHARFSPYVAAGGGTVWFQQSLTTLASQPNRAPRNSYAGAFEAGIGADYTLRRWLGFRAEIRDFSSGNPIFNIPVSGRQHNIVASGGFTLRLGRAER